MSNDTSSPAFPIVGQWGVSERGMTLRDYFAASAIAGILANPDISASAARCNVTTEQFREDTSKAAYAVADIMLKARNA